MALDTASDGCDRSELKKKSGGAGKGLLETG